MTSTTTTTADTDWAAVVIIRTDNRQELEDLQRRLGDIRRDSVVIYPVEERGEAVALADALGDIALVLKGFQIGEHNS
jgi:hypothetical protein